MNIDPFEPQPLFKRSGFQRADSCVAPPTIGEVLVPRDTEILSSCNDSDSGMSARDDMTENIGEDVAANDYAQTNAGDVVELSDTVKHETSDIEKWSKLKNVARKAAIAVELGCGPLRYGGFLGILRETGSVPLSVGFLAGSTLLTETAGVYAVSDVLDRDESKFLRKINEILDSKIDRSKRLGVLGKVAISNYFGVPAMLAATHREKPEQTKRENIKRGMIASGILTGAIAVQGVLIAEGATNITEPKVVVPAVATIVGMYALGKKALNKISIKKQDESGE